MPEGNVEVVRRGFDAFNARHVDELLATSAADSEWMPFRAQLEGTPYRGHEGVRRFVRDMDEDWDEFRIEPVEFHEAGDLVVVIGRVKAVGGGSGVNIDSLAGFVLEVHGGLITRLTSHSDPEAALEAIR
ncbi:MAG: SnoaL-like domain [Thermoleophilaceae bacterium]|jgi:ketosteroid isomerase-like protein|nr:SnoaL-like domain [Thermoleophilaceae bacterium]